MGAFILLEIFFLQLANITFTIKILIKIKMRNLLWKKMCIKDIEQYRGQHLLKSKRTGALFMRLFLILSFAKV